MVPTVYCIKKQVIKGLAGLSRGLTVVEADASNGPAGVQQHFLIVAAEMRNQNLHQASLDAGLSHRSYKQVHTETRVDILKSLRKDFLDFKFIKTL